LPIFREERIIFNINSAGERVIQDVALLMAEKLAEFVIIESNNRIVNRVEFIQLKKIILKLLNF
jgi:phosphotransacetylase